MSLFLKFDLKVYLHDTEHGASLAPTVDHNGYPQLYWSDLFCFWNMIVLWFMDTFVKQVEHFIENVSHNPCCGVMCNLFIAEPRLLKIKGTTRLICCGGQLWLCSACKHRWSYLGQFCWGFLSAYSLFSPQASSWVWLRALAYSGILCLQIGFCYLLVLIALWKQLLLLAFALI